MSVLKSDMDMAKLYVQFVAQNRPQDLYQQTSRANMVTKAGGLQLWLQGEFQLQLDCPKKWFWGYL